MVEENHKEIEASPKLLIDALLVVKLITPNMRRNHPESAWSSDYAENVRITPAKVEIEALPPNDAVDLNCEVY